MTDTRMFFAETRDRVGRKRHSVMAETRCEAVEKVFDLDPNANSCSTAKAHLQPDGQWFNTGSGLIWHRRNGT